MAALASLIEWKWSMTTVAWSRWPSRPLASPRWGSRPVERTLRLEQIPWDEVLEFARQAGIEDVSTVELGVLEVSGKMSFITHSS